MQAEGGHALLLQDPEAFLQLGMREAVFRLTRVSHDRIADGETSSGIVAQADTFRNTSVGPQQLDIGDIVQVDKRPKCPGLGKLLRRHGVRAEDNLFPGKPACFRQGQFSGRRAVQSASFLLKNPEDRRVWQRLHRKIFPEIRAPGKCGVQAAGPAA